MNIFEDFTTKPVSHEKRSFPIDFFRFLAIILMVIFHTGYDLAMFGYFIIEPYEFFGFYLPRIIVTLFLLSSGLSLNRNPSTDSLKNSAMKLMPRFIKLFVFAIIISIVTRFMFPNNWIYFGTLHCLAALSLIAIFLRGRPKTAFVLGISIQLNYFTDFISFIDPLEAYVSIKSVDFIPLYPWAGVFLIGMGIAPLIKHLEVSMPSFIARPISIISQKSLPIYLIHQPILYSSVFLFNSLNS